MRFTYEGKKERVKELLQQQEVLEKELRSLLEPERVSMLPRGFSMSIEVLRSVQEAGQEGISPQEILQVMQKKYGEGIDREKVASALAYLKNTKRTVSQTTRGVYVYQGTQNTLRE